MTEQPGEKPIGVDLGDARLDLFPAGSDAARSTMDQQGVAWATATSYGNTITYTPEDSAARAFDGDVETAWRAAAFGAAIGQVIRVDLDDAITTDHVNLVQPINGPRDRYITNVRLRFDGGRPVDAELDASSRTATGQTIAFPTRHFRRLEIEVTGSNVGNRRLAGNANAVGFAEVRLADTKTGAPVRVREVVRMPSDLLAATGPASTEHPLVVLMTRDRILPVPPRSDPERAIAREFTLPAAREFALDGHRAGGERGRRVHDRGRAGRRHRGGRRRHRHRRRVPAGLRGVRARSGDRRRPRRPRGRRRSSGCVASGPTTSSRRRSRSTT